ncbi:MAG: hypothetical protein L6437_07380 [Kiritimatiellae bacterium]|nr:hypothetical protein [Kiritimatiellia bacterium]
MTSQLRRCAVSITSNSAKDYGIHLTHNLCAFVPLPLCA